MRLIRKNIWRAFLELDAYSDEQCARFVRSAEGRASARVGRVLLFLLANAVMIGVALFFTILVFNAIESIYSPGRFEPSIELVGIIVILDFVAPMFITLVFRDAFLRKRILRVLRNDALCRSCGYSLLGLPLTSDHHITCPECGFKNKVDPSLAQLTRNDTANPKLAGTKD